MGTECVTYSHIMLTLILLSLVGLSHQGSLVTLEKQVDTKNIRPCKAADVLRWTVAVVDLSSFDDDVISVPGCKDMKQKNVIQQPFSRAGGVDVAKSVDYINNGGCDAVFSIRGEHIFGNIDTPTADFVLEPCSAFEGCHVWKEEDTSTFIDDEPMEMTEYRELSSNRNNNEELRQKGIDDNTTIVTFSIKFYYTKDFADVTDDIELYFDQVTAETNQGYINSLIPLRMKIHCIEPADLNDIWSSGEMLSTFRKYKGSTEALRGGADAAALVVKDFSGCGRGYLDAWRWGGTVTAQTKGCALGYYTMGHELGHNFGCNHDREHASSKGYPYGFGAYIGDGPYRTCMSYHKSGYYKKANIFSSSVAEFEVSGKKMITGTETEDNARVFRENRFAVAALGDEQETCDWKFTSTEKPPPTTTTTTTWCTDENEYCGAWAYAGYCEEYSSYMSSNCPVVCNKCGSNPVCKDKNSYKSCTYLAKSGECESNPSFMSANCPATCNYCEDKTTWCEDLNSKCESWAGQGYCDSYKDYMMANCPVSCDKCANRPACKDKKQKCGQWTDEGYCKRDPVYMYYYCPLSCKVCGNN